LNKYQDAVDSYKKSLELEPNNATAVEALAQAEAKLKEASQAPAAGAIPGMPGMPPLNSQNMAQAMNAFQSMLGGQGAGGAPGGLPNLGGLFNNPNFANMAQQLMSNPQFMNMYDANFFFWLVLLEFELTRIVRCTGHSLWLQTQTLWMESVK